MRMSLLLILSLMVAFSLTGHAAEKVDEPDLGVLTLEVPTGVLSVLEDINKARMEIRTQELDYELRGRDTSVRKIEKLKEDVAESVTDLKETLERETRQERSNIDRLYKAKNRLLDQRDRQKSEEAEARYKDKIAQVEAMMTEPEAIIAAYDKLYEAVRGWGGTSRSSSLFAAVDKELSPIQVVQADGKAVDLQKMSRDKGMVLTFWSAQNKPSSAAAAQMLAMRDELLKADFEVVLVTVDKDLAAARQALGRGADKAPLYHIDAETLKGQLEAPLLPLTLIALPGSHRVQSISLESSSKLKNAVTGVLKELADRAKMEERQK